MQTTHARAHNASFANKTSDVHLQIGYGCMYIYIYLQEIVGFLHLNVHIILCNIYVLSQQVNGVGCIDIEYIYIYIYM